MKITISTHELIRTDIDTLLMTNIIYLPSVTVGIPNPIMYTSLLSYPSL